MEPLRERYVEHTRQALLDAARRLFGRRGYADISAAELAREAGLTRGALYHHFDGKRGLFEAIFIELEQQAAQRIREAVDALSDPFERVDRGAATFLEICTEDEYRHIVLRQGVIALGWQRVIELDQHYLGVILLGGVRTLLDSGLIKPHPVELIASAFYGALTDLALTIAEADDPQRARTEAASLLSDLVGGLRRAPS
jgi:AcrR family transcriptional regulator